MRSVCTRALLLATLPLVAVAADPIPAEEIPENALSVVATDALRVVATGDCPTAAEVEHSLTHALERAFAGAMPAPPKRALEVRLAAQDADAAFSLEVVTDGRVVMARSFRDEARDCEARADTAALSLTRYLEEIAWQAPPPEPTRLQARQARQALVPQPIARRRWWIDLGLGGLATGSVDETNLDVGPELALRVGTRPVATSLRVGWLYGGIVEAPGSIAASARIDRLPITWSVDGMLTAGAVDFFLGPRVVLEVIRASGQAPGLATDAKLGVRAGAEAEVTLRFASHWIAGIGFAGDVSVRRYRVLISQEPIAAQALLVPSGRAWVGALWDL